MQLSYGSTLPVKLADPLSNCPASRQKGQKGSFNSNNVPVPSTYQRINQPVLQPTSTSTDRRIYRPAYQSTAYQSTAYQSTSALLITSLLHAFFNSAASGSQLRDLGFLSGRS